MLLAVSGAQGQSQGHLWYDPHGSVLSSTLPVTLTEHIGLDSRLGLVYHGDGRYYDPAIAHTLQPDPLGGVPQLPQTLNRYAVTPAPALSAVEGRSVVGQVQARGGGLAIAAAGELAEELTETGIGKAVGWYATRRTAVAVGRLIIWTRRYSFLACISHLPNRIEKVYLAMGCERPIRRMQGEGLGHAGATPTGLGGEVGFPLGPGRTSPLPTARAYAATCQSLGGGKARDGVSPAGSRR